MEDGRQDALEKEEERVNRRAELMGEAIEAFEQNIQAMKDELRANGEDTNDGNIDNDVFDEEDFKAQFDEENPPILIPDEIEDDVDNDYNIVDESVERK